MSLRMGSNQGTSRANALDKRVPRNPRYAGVKSKVETGMTVDKVSFVTTRQHLRRQEEPYFRLTPSQLNELLSEYEQDQQEGVQDFRDHIDPDHHGPKIVEYEPDARPSYDRPYLIIDVRPPEEFKRCRITQARSFEAKLLNQDRMTPELYMYKNREGGLVVLYSNDDAEASNAARTLIHRGFDNIFVLSGGLVAFVRGGFHDFVEGDTKSLTPAASASGDGGSLRATAVPKGSSTSSSNGAGARANSENDKRSRSTGLRGGGTGGGGGGGGRLEYRYRGGQSVIVRGGGNGYGSGKYNSTSSTSSSTRNCSLGGGRGKHDRPEVITGLRGGGLAEAAAAASAARRRSLQGGRQSEPANGGGDMSKGSAITVADSVISRSTARRGKW